MRPATLLTVLLPLIAATTANHQGNPLFCSTCGLGSGEDVCRQTKCTPLVVRPMEVPKPILPVPKVVCAPVGGIPPLIPVGGPCSCHTSIVKPAVLPKPQCNTCCSMQTNSQHSHHLETNYNVAMSSGASRPVLVDDVMQRPMNPAHTVPADAVSLAIAYKMAQEACHQSEDRLAFGFRTMPKEMPAARRRTNNIAEENLFNLNGQIVELKPIKCAASGKTLDEEAAEELLELSDEDKEAPGEFKHVSLGEIGYDVAKIKSTNFINVPLTNPLQLIEEKVGEAVKCNDGFKPGNVIIQQVPKPEFYDFPVQLPEPCDESGEVYIPPPPVQPPSCGCGQMPCSCPYFMGSSSSSTSNCHKKMSSSVMFQKLGCD